MTKLSSTPRDFWASVDRLLKSIKDLGLSDKYRRDPCSECGSTSYFCGCPGSEWDE